MSLSINNKGYMWSKTCIINLKNAKLRLKSCKSQLKRENIKGEKCIEAVDGYKYVPYGKEIKSKKKVKYHSNLMRKKLTEKGIYKKTIRALRVGEIGIYMSQINTIKAAYKDKKIKSILILEDDIKLSENLLENIKKLKSYIPKKCDIFFLGVSPINYKYGKFKKINKYINEPLGINPNKIKEMDGGIYGAHAYILNRKAMKVLIDNAFPMRYPYDVYLGKIITRMKLLKAYSLKDDLITTFNYGSFTQHTKTIDN
jgi:GR25 family glycosyltransferase involved in LPS biosynthesis